MKYSELISFKPIESTIQLLETADKKIAQDMVQTYVMSDTMADNLKATVIAQLQMEEVIDNKAVMIVGNYGTGKSHLMSVIAAIATDADNTAFVQNKKFGKDMEIVAGKFEVLRLKVDGLTMPLREVILAEIEDDFANRGIDYTVPNLDNVRDNARLIKEVMQAFQSKYPDKGYLIVIDELLSYLTSRDERQIVLDLAFLQSMAEMCSKSKIRLICGVQEKVFDNPRFSFVSETLKKVGDRFTQIIITKEATAYVVSERILKKTPEQKAMIRQHLEKFSGLYAGMSSKMDDFVDLFPIHPSYIEVFNKIYLIENRHILKNISLTIKEIFNKEVPADKPGVISFDDYWPAIKSNGLLKSDVTISRVVGASGQLEEIINRSFTKAAYKPMALQIIYALSVHRLTTNGLDVQFGLTAENLKDDLCLYLSMPEQDADFLLGAVNATLKEIMKTVSGQFIIHNDANNQYYIDVDKVVDYDERIKQKASMMAEGELNRYFYTVVYGCLEWEARQYVNGFNIYQYDLNWDSHNIFREGYLFMGLPGERSTAQPERDFYIHIMPPFGDVSADTHNLDDEVYFYFRGSDEFKEMLRMFAAANAQADISEGKDKDAYLGKAQMLKKKLVKYLSENKNTCFNVTYKCVMHQLIEVLKGKYNRDMTFKDTIDLAASISLDEYFGTIYPGYPVMKTKITRKNQADAVRSAFDHFAGRKNQQSTQMLQSFGILDGDKIRPEGSKYASYYIDMIKQLQPQGVLNYSDIFEPANDDMFVDKKFKINYLFTPIVFLSLVYAGYAVITLKDGSTLTASNLDKVPKMSVFDLYEFKYISRPAQISMAELKKLFEVLDINPAFLDNPNDREKGVAELLKKTQEMCNNAVILERRLTDGFELWGEPLANSQQVSMMRGACTAVKNEFSNYAAKYNTPAKLNNFSLSYDEVEELGKKIALLKLIPEYTTFKTDCSDIVSYIANIEFIELGASMKSDIENGKAAFREIRDSIMDGTLGDVAAQKVVAKLEKIKDKYIDIYFEEHKKKRLGIDDAKRRGKIQESAALGNLRKLRGIEILSSAKLGELEQDMAGLKVCYELTPTELKASPICPHCRYNLEDKAKNVMGQLDSLENRIDDMVAEWTKMLLDTISDPIVLDQKKFLKAQEAQAIDEFVATGSLPKKVDDFFVKSINALLKGFEPVVIDTDDLIKKLEEMPPMDEASFKAKVNEIVSAYTKGKDTSKLRIVVKRRESEE
ncbi:DUF6079 family protein [Bacteroides caecimuris]|jgi:hypothetical protein|uniref:DUF6079 family protein n=1 Tax=Bacteroides caecimuris TaxID=1796613 RepID=UPI0032209F9B